MVLESLVERSSTFTKLYVYIVEEKLAEALTSFKVLEEGQFVRRTNTRWVGLQMGGCGLGQGNDV